MLSFRELSEKKTKIKINPRKEEVMEGGCGTMPKMAKGGEVKRNHGEDCDCMKCEKKRRAEDLGDEKTVSTEQTAYVSQEEVSEESTKESETEIFLTFGQFNEGRAEDAKASLEKVKARQKVLDTHEKKTGKKLDISKTPEHKAHKKNFPGAKRQEKKVKGAKETDLQKHNRQVQTYTDRLKKYGKTKKQAAYDKAMSKQTSRYD